MRRGGVDIDRAPKEAVDMLIEANTLVEDDPELRERGSSGRARVEAEFVCSLSFVSLDDGINPVQL
jgi:hypothetical protein